MGNMKMKLSRAVQRFREPSTWGGISVLLMAFGFSAEDTENVFAVLTAASATIAIFLPEQPKP